MTGPEERAELLPLTSSGRYPELHIIHIDPLDIAAAALAKLKEAGHHGYISLPEPELSSLPTVVEGEPAVIHHDFTPRIQQIEPITEVSVPEEEQESLAADVIDLEEYRKRQKDVLRGKALLDHIKRAQNGDEKARERLWVDAQAMAGWLLQRRPSGILEHEDQFQVCLEVVPWVIKHFDFDKGAAYPAYLYGRMLGATIDAERKAIKSNGLSRTAYRNLTEALQSDNPNEQLHQLIKRGFEYAAQLVSKDHIITPGALSLDQLRESPTDGSKKVIVEPVAPESVEQQASHMFDVAEVVKYLAILSPNERYAVEQHLGLYGRQPRTMRDIGEDLGVTESRISQIFNNGLERMSRRVSKPEGHVTHARTKNRLRDATEDRMHETRSQIESHMRVRLIKLGDAMLANNEIASVVDKLDGWRHSVREGNSGLVHVLKRSDVTNEQFDLAAIHINRERCKIGFMDDAFVMISKDVRGVDLLNVIDIQQAVRANGFDNIPYDEEVRAQLSERELGILADLWKPYKLIAREQGLAVSTVRTHIHNMLARFNLRNCEELIIFGARKGLIGLGDVPEGRTDNVRGKPRQILIEHYPTSTYEEIAQAYNISVSTARTHIHEIFVATQAQTSHQIALMALRDGLIPLQEPEE